MIKLSKILSEIKVTPRITPEKVIKLKNSIDLFPEDRGEYNPQKYIKWKKIWDNLWDKYDLEEAKFQTKDDLIRFLNQKDLNQLYKDLLDLNSLKEIKIIGSVTLEMILRLRLKIIDGIFQKFGEDTYPNLYQEWRELWENIEKKFDIEEDTGTGKKFIYSLKILNQTQLKEIYRELKNFEQKL